MDRISILEEAFYVVKHKATLRETAKVFNCSKSKIHKDMMIHLKKIDPILANDINKILCYNKSSKRFRLQDSM